MTQTNTSTALERIYDRQLDSDVLRLLPGDYYASADGEILTTVLGSCVSACIRDAERGIGGMNHFMLPGLPASNEAGNGAAGRYGTHAMQFLIDDIVKLGGDVANFEIKLFGGGRIVEGLSDVGKSNIAFVRQYLASSGMTVAAEDLGLEFPRKIHYFAHTGKVLVKKLRSLHNRTVAADEQRFRDEKSG